MRREKSSPSLSKATCLRKLRLWYTWLPPKKNPQRDQLNPDILSRCVNYILIMPFRVFFFLLFCTHFLFRNQTSRNPIRDFDFVQYDKKNQIFILSRAFCFFLGVLLNQILTQLKKIIYHSKLFIKLRFKSVEKDRG